MRVTAIWSGEELEVLFSADLSCEDIGDERSHYVDLIDDVVIEEVSIWGIPVPLDNLPPKLLDELMSVADGLEFSE